MDPSSNTPQSSRSKTRQRNPGHNPFRVDTLPPMYIPNPMFAGPTFGGFNPFGMGYPSPQGSPSLPTQVAYNEFRYQSQSPQPNFEFDNNDIRPDFDFIAETQEVPETQDVPENEAPSQSRGKKRERPLREMRTRSGHQRGKWRWRWGGSLFPKTGKSETRNQMTLFGSAF